MNSNQDHPILAEAYRKLLSDNFEDITESIHRLEAYMTRQGMTRMDGVAILSTQLKILQKEIGMLDEHFFLFLKIIGETYTVDVESKHSAMSPVGSLNER